jgi:Na+/melibiose symporter-like transporter
MAAFGYVANAQQTPQAQWGINFTVNLLPAILFFVAAAVAFIFWKMSDQDANEIRQKLYSKKAAEN